MTPHNAAASAYNSYSSTFTANSRGIGRLRPKSIRRDVCDVSGEGWDLEGAGLALGSHPTASS